MRGILQLVVPPLATDATVIESPEMAVYALPLVDRPFAQHAIEVMIDLGVTELDLIVPFSRNAYLADFLTSIGNGSRFGSHIRWWYVPAEQALTDLFAGLFRTMSQTEPLLYGLADQIPLLARLPEMVPAEGMLLSDSPDGWIFAPAGVIQQGGPYRELIPPPHLLSYQTASTILEAQQLVLSGKASPMIPAPIRNSRYPDSVYVARGATISPSAHLIGPCWIGPGCHIGANVEVGTNVVLSEDCIVEPGTILQNLLALPGTYIGEGLECDSAIINGATLVSARHNTCVSIPDPFLLSSYS